jgi:hypothetical protein
MPGGVVTCPAKPLGPKGPKAPGPAAESRGPHTASKSLTGPLSLVAIFEGGAIDFLPSLRAKGDPSADLFVVYGITPVKSADQISMKWRASDIAIAVCQTC